MKTIILNTLTLENFKGVRSYKVTFHPTTTNIYGANATGKTTLIDSINWLLFGKDSAGRSDFQIRPVDETGKMVDNVDIIVEAQFAVDGQPTTLRKTQRQNWVKKRGATVATFSGNTNSYEVDGFPATQKEFDAKVASMVDETVFRLLTDPRAFPRLDWKKQREILLRFVYDVTDADIMNTDPGKYDPIFADVIQAGSDKAKEKATKELRLLKDKQKEYPTRIDEALIGIEETPDEKVLLDKKQKISEELETLKRNRDDLMFSANETSEIRMQIMDTEAKMSKMVHDAEEQASKARFEARMAKLSLESDIARLKTQYESNQKSIETVRTTIKDTEAEINELAAEYKRVRARALPEDETICPTCGKPYDSDKVEEVRKSFEERKSRDLSRITAKGTQKREAANQSAEFLKGKEDGQKTIQAELNKKETEYAEMVSKTVVAPDAFATVETNPEYVALKDTRDSLKERLANMDSDETLRNSFNHREEELRGFLKSIDGGLARIEANRKAMDRADVLREELRDVTQKVSDQEQKLYLLDEFIKAKMDMLSEKINSKFKSVRFRLFDVQINGGVKDTCVMQIASNGSYVDYPNANNAAQIQGGLDVINALAELYDVSVPVWIDNRESVTKIPETNAQVVNLIVNPAYKKLEVVTDLAEGAE